METHKADAAIRGLVQAIRSMASAGGATGLLDYLGLLGDLLAFYRNSLDTPMDWAYQELVASLPEPADRLIAAAYDADSRQLHQAAACLAESAADLAQNPLYTIALAGFLRKNGETGRSRELCRSVGQHSDGQQVMSELFMCEVAETFWSLDYYGLLAAIHRKFHPRTYLEIGVATGKSLALAGSGTRALGIDPVAAESSRLLYHSLTNEPLLYKMTSDDFFATEDVRQEMGCPQFDLAFIDGLHHFDQVLRDFIHLEQFTAPESVILIHDCLPVDPQVATRERSTAFWTGDVWKIIPCLRAVRPDLQIVTLPLPPAGLAVVCRLDNSSRVLARHYSEVVERFDSLELPASWDERCSLLNVETDEASFSLDRLLPPGGWS